MSVVLTGADANSDVTFTARSGQRVIDIDTVTANADGRAEWTFSSPRVTGIVNLTAAADVTYLATEKHPYPPTKPEHTTCRVQVWRPRPSTSRCRGPVSTGSRSSPWAWCSSVVAEPPSRLPSAASVGASASDPHQPASGPRESGALACPGIVS